MDIDVARRWPVNSSVRAVLEELLVAGPLSRADLARRMGLSPATLTKVTRPLVDGGYVQESAAAPSDTGRPALPLDVRPDFAHFIGIKLTGDALYAVTTDARAEVVRATSRTLLSQSPEGVVAQVVEVVSELRATTLNTVGACISLSGTAVRSSPTVPRSGFMHWSDVPLGDAVTAATGLPTVLENDVRALTAVEQWFGGAKGVDDFAVITVGAGIGCGMVVGGRQIEGRRGASGLIGHLPIDERGPLCYAGHRGCAHAFATTGGLCRTISAGLGVTLLSFEECLELARQDDPIARTAFSEAGRAIGQMIAVVANLLGPEKVFVTGEGAAMYQLGEQAAQARLAELLHWTAEAPELVVQPFDFTEWARGAAVVAVQEYVRSLTELTELPTPSS